MAGRSPPLPVHLGSSVASTVSVTAQEDRDRDLSLWLIGMFVVLAFALSLAGIHGVLSCAVAARLKEFAIRAALGADARTLLRLVLTQGGWPIAVGVIIGVAGALGVTRFLRALLYGVTATDPLTFAGATVVLVGVSLLACLTPARRATSVDPIVVLRHE